MRGKVEDLTTEGKYSKPIHQAGFNPIVIRPIIIQAKIVLHLKVPIITTQTIETQIIAHYETIMETEALILGGDNVIL
jgi:hypothetical protein